MEFIIWAIIRFLWAFSVLGTCAYAVFWQGHSGWWFLLAIMLCSGRSYHTEKNGE